MKENRLQLLIEGLDKAGIKKYGRNTVVANKIGYSVSSVAKILQGHSPLSDKFINLVSIEFGIDWKSVVGVDIKNVSLTPTCSNCMFWFDMEDEEIGGLCRIRAPRMGSFHPKAIWPQTRRSEWCGEHEVSLPIGGDDGSNTV